MAPLLLILFSAAAATAALFLLKQPRRLPGLISLAVGFALGVAFLAAQVTASRDRIYLDTGAWAATFFMAEGYHGYLVLIGLGLLAISGLWVAFAPTARLARSALSASVWTWTAVAVLYLILAIARQALT